MCKFDADCINVTAPASGVTLINLRGQPILGGAYKTGIKGRLNFLTSNSKSHIITLVDSAPDRTLSAMGSNNRPSYDKNDAYIGCDSNYCQEAHTGIAIGAPVSISGYIANAGDGAAWKERLTATQKSFAVPIKTPGATLKLSTNEIAAHTCSVAQTVALAGLSPDSVIKRSFARTPIGVAGYGTGTLQISTFATTDTADFVVCNITSSSVTPGAIAVNVREEQ